MRVSKEKVRQVLMDAWLDLRNDASQTKLQRFWDGVDVLNAVGLLTDDERELWRRRVLDCPTPSHNDEGGRTWCAYCGNLIQDVEKVSQDMHPKKGG